MSGCLAWILARDIMVTKLITVRPNMDLRDAAKLLVKNKISGAPVVDEEVNLLGLLTEKDLMTALIDAIYDELPSTEVRAYMEPNPHTITEELDLLSIAQIFQTHPYRRIPVLQGRRLVGQISRRDVIRAAIQLIEPAQDRKHGDLVFERASWPRRGPIRLSH